MTIMAPQQTVEDPMMLDDTAPSDRADARHLPALAGSEPARSLEAPLPSNNDLAAEISSLEKLDLHALRIRWRKLMRKEPPEHLGKALLIRIISYRLQARVYGDLDAASVKLLEGIARDHERRRKAGEVKPKAVPIVAPAARDRGHRPGTIFVREYAGETHRVCVAAGGFEWQGTIYRSLSEIARCITGTTWNGPRFFGLRDNLKEPPNFEQVGGARKTLAGARS